MNSQTGYLGFAKQASKGTWVTPSYFVKYSNDDIGYSSEPIIPSAEIGGGRDITDVYPGPGMVDGGLTFDVRSNFAGLTLYLVSGTDTPANPTTGVYRHVITPANELPWFSAQKKVSDTYDIFNYTDLKLNSLTLSCQAGQQLTAQLDVKGLTESGGASEVTDTVDAGEVLMWHSAEIKLENSTICPKSINIEISNNLEDDDYRICPTAGRGLSSLPEKRRTLNATLTIRPEDNDLYQKAVYGEDNAEAPTKKVYSGSLWAKFESVNAITGAYKYYIEVSVPKVFFKPFKISPTGEDTIEHGLDLIGANAGSGLYTITVQNTVASYTS